MRSAARRAIPVEGAIMEPNIVRKESSRGPQEGHAHGRRGPAVPRRERWWRRHRTAVTLTAAAIAGYALYKNFAKSPTSPGKNAIFVSKSITIDRPVSDIYRFWRHLENLPRAMSHLESVQERPNGRSHWVAKGPAGRKIEWDAEMLVDRENEIISWRSVEGADVPNEGTVRFKDVGNGQRTEVKVSLTYHPPGGALGAAIAKLFGEEPSQQVEEDLRKLKKELESKGSAQSNPAAAGPATRRPGN
jgi:uncharacterized membrane protein